MTEAEALALTPELPSERWLFRVAAAAALALHAVVVFGAPGLHGGEDLVPHLRLIELMRDKPGLHNVYAPAYHVLGALLSNWVGLDLYPRLFRLRGGRCADGGVPSLPAVRWAPRRFGRPLLFHALPGVSQRWPIDHV